LLWCGLPTAAPIRPQVSRNHGDRLALKRETFGRASDLVGRPDHNWGRSPRGSFTPARRCLPPVLRTPTIVRGWACPMATSTPNDCRCYPLERLRAGLTRHPGRSHSGGGRQLRRSHRMQPQKGFGDAASINAGDRFGPADDRRFRACDE